MKTYNVKIFHKIRAVKWHTTGVILTIIMLSFAIWYTRFNLIKQTAPFSDRIQERERTYNDIHALGHVNMDNISWINQSEGILHIPITNAMVVVAGIYSNKDTARSSFLHRIEKVNNNKTSAIIEK